MWALRPGESTEARYWLSQRPNNYYKEEGELQIISIRDVLYIFLKHTGQADIWAWLHSMQTSDCTPVLTIVAERFGDLLPMCLSSGNKHMGWRVWFINKKILLLLCQRQLDSNMPMRFRKVSYSNNNKKHPQSTKTSMWGTTIRWAVYRPWLK